MSNTCSLTISPYRLDSLSKGVDSPDISVLSSYAERNLWTPYPDGKRLRDFDRDQTVMSWRLATTIYENVRLVGCSRSIAVSTYAKWINNGETCSRRYSVGYPHVIKGKDHRRFPCLVKQNSSQTVAQLAAKCNAKPSRNVSEHTV